MNEPIQLFEIDQQSCQLRYGEGRCAAALGTTGEAKCYNTRGTCQDPENFSPRGEMLSFDGTSSAEATDAVSVIPEGGAVSLSLHIEFPGIAAPASMVRIAPADSSLHDFECWFGGSPLRLLVRFTADGGSSQLDSWDAEPAAVSGRNHVLLTRSEGSTRWTATLNGTELDPVAENITGARGFGGGAAKIGELTSSNFGEFSLDEICLWARVLDEQASIEVRRRRVDFIADLDVGAGLLHNWRIREGESLPSDSVAGADFDTTAGGPTVVPGILPTPLVLRFTRPCPDVWRYARRDRPLFPVAGAIRTTPLKINLGGMDESASPFGQREKASVSLGDFTSDDRAVDKYAEERPTGDAGTSFDPEENGTFWSKWAARNQFYNRYPCRVFDGTVGQDLHDMRSRHYVLTEFSGPDGGSSVMKMEDLFTAVEDRKAKGPRASRGVLTADLLETAGVGDTFAVTPAGIADDDYADIDASTSGRVRINDEIILATRSGATFTIVERGVDSTEIEEHEADDTVQFCERFDGVSAPRIVETLLTKYTAVRGDQIPIQRWLQQSLPFAYSATISEPVEISELIGELAEQAGFTLWPDVYSDIIELRALQPEASDDFEVRDDNWILEGTPTVKRMDRERVSQVWFYFGQRNPTRDLDDVNNYRTTVVTPDLESEGEDQYGEPSVKQIFSRWVRVRAAAEQASDRILSIYRDPPLMASFGEDLERDGMLRIARPFNLVLSDRPNEIGLPFARRFVPISMERTEFGRSIKAQQLRFFAPPEQDRILNIDNDAQNYNIREQHDLAFSQPAQSGDVVRVVISEGVRIWSSSTTAYAFQTGLFPDGVTIKVTQRPGAAIAGAGGVGGDGGDGFTGTSDPSGEDGGEGGAAVLAQHPIDDWDNQGTIAAGGGGGGGGGGNIDSTPTALAGGAGGGGAAFGEGGADPSIGSPETPSDDGGFELGGDGGIGEIGSDANGGDGGDGGDWNQPGQPGQEGTTDGGEPGNGGAPGPAIDGDSLITFSNEGTILGARIN